MQKVLTSQLGELCPVGPPTLVGGEREGEQGFVQEFSLGVGGA